MITNCNTMYNIGDTITFKDWFNNNIVSDKVIGIRIVTLVGEKGKVTTNVEYSTSYRVVKQDEVVPPPNWDEKK